MEMMATPVLDLLAVVWVPVVLQVSLTLLELLECFATIIIIIDPALPRVPWISPDEQGQPILLPEGGKTGPLLVVLLELLPPIGMAFTMLPELLVKGTFPAAAAEAPE